MERPLDIQELRRGRRRRLLLASTLALALATIGPTLGRVEARVAVEPSQVDEYALKSAFLYNFARYTKWPDAAFKDAEAPIAIGILGKDPFGTTLDKALEGKTVGKRKFVVQRFVSIDELTPVHVLFVASSEEKQVEKLRSNYADKPVMLVAESLAAAEQGAQIGFFFERSKVRFAINTTAMKAARLEASSELLKLAKIVETPAKEARQ